MKKIICLALVFAFILISFPAVFAQETEVDADIVGIETEVFYDDSIDNDFGVLDLRSKEVVSVMSSSSTWNEGNWSNFFCSNILGHTGTWVATSDLYISYFTHSQYSTCYYTNRDYRMDCERTFCSASKLGGWEYTHDHSWVWFPAMSYYWCSNQGPVNGVATICTAKS